MPFHYRVLAGFVIGTLLGLLIHAMHWDQGLLLAFIDNIAQPIGQLFLRLLKMLILPLMFSALVVGIGQLGDVASLGRMGGRTLGYTALTSSIAVLIGVGAANLIQPGVGVDREQLDALMQSYASGAAAITTATPTTTSVPDTLLALVPDNVVKAAAAGDYIGVLIFGLFVGIGLVLAPAERTRGFRDAIDGLFEITITLVNLVIRMAPYAVACIMLALAAKFGWDLLEKLAKYAFTVVGALALHLFVVMPAFVRIFGGMSPRRFFKDSQEALLMAFSTASSAATLPTALRVAEENLKLPPQVSRFVLTVGATANQHGTALFEGVTVLFLAQFFGIELSLGQQFLVIGMSILGGIGTAGVPAGSLPVIVMICGMVGVPPEGIAIILGIDRLLDMCRTTLNVGGDLALAVVVAKAGERDLARAASLQTTPP